MQRRASSWCGAVMAPVGQAGMQARAGAAVRAGGFVDGQRQVGEDLADEEVRAGIARDEIGVLAYPPEAGVARQRLLEHGPGVDEHAITHRPDALDDVVGQPLQGVAQHLVIVAAQRITRDVAQLRVGQRVGGVVRVRRASSSCAPTARAPCRAPVPRVACGACRVWPCSPSRRVCLRRASGRDARHRHRARRR